VRDNLTQDEISDRLGVTRSAVGNWEQGSREPDFETAELIADFFNVDLDYLLGRQENDSSKKLYIRQMAQSIYDNELLKKIFEDIVDMSEDSLINISNYIKDLKMN
jgi:transcriptional regulator with XRE-family HTH domain